MRSSMAEFVVRLADERGRVQEQTHTAATEEELRARFTQAGYYVYSVKARGLLAGAGKTKKVKLETFLVFNQQFLTLIRAGLPILGSIELLARRQKLPHFRAQLEDVATRVKNGESISEAFVAQGGFPVVYTTTLLAGERSGNLEEVLQRYLDFQRVSLTFRKKLLASLIYPAVLVVMVIGLFIFLITFVVPRFAELYEQLGTKLPAITTFLLALGTNAQSYGIYALAALALAIFLFVRWIKTDAGANLVDRVRIGLPLIGPVWLKYQVGLFARTLATLLTGGLPLVPIAGDRGPLHRQPPDQQRRLPQRRDGARGQGPLHQPRRDKNLPRAGRRDGRGRRIHRRTAPDAQLRRRVLRGGRADQPHRRHEPHRAHHPHRHGMRRGHHPHLALPAHLQHERRLRRRRAVTP